MKERVLLTLQDGFLIPMDLPPLNERDTALAAEAQLPAHYPHSLEGIVWDIIRKGDQCLVFLMKKDRLDEIRREKGSQVELVSTAQFIPVLPETSPCVCRWSSPDGQDLYFLRGNTLEQAVHIATGLEIKTLLSAFFSEDIPLIRELKEKPGNRPLFQFRKKSLFPILIPLLPFLAVLFLLFLSFAENQKLKVELAEQEKILNRQKQYWSQPVETYPWEQVYTLLNENLPPDYYTLLEVLYPSFKGRGEILTLSIEGRELHLEAVSSDGLIILEDLKSRGLFNSLTLHQIRRDEDQDIFTLSGSFR